jgi:hypothetical protein
LKRRRQVTATEGAGGHRLQTQKAAKDAQLSLDWGRPHL